MSKMVTVWRLSVKDKMTGNRGTVNCASASVAMDLRGILLRRPSYEVSMPRRAHIRPVFSDALHGADWIGDHLWDGK